jgi:hypothetical protein
MMARRRFGDALPEGFPTDRAEDGALAVSELVSFGLRHGLAGDRGEGALELVVLLEERGVHVQVRHEGALPAGRGWRAVEDSVLELLILNSVTDAWGVLADGRGAWFTISQELPPVTGRRVAATGTG